LYYQPTIPNIMKKGSTLFLKGVIYAIGLGVLILCIFVFPRIIGEFQIGGYDPILIGMYVPAIPFFIALYQSLKLLGYIDGNNTFSELSVQSLRKIKYCGVAISTLYILGMPYIFYVADKDDAPGVVGIACIIIFASFVIGTFAAVLEKLLKNVLEIKSENELTV
jgi:hypothetical protein